VEDRPVPCVCRLIFLLYLYQTKPKKNHHEWFTCRKGHTPLNIQEHSRPCLVKKQNLWLLTYLRFALTSAKEQKGKQTPYSDDPDIFLLWYVSQPCLLSNTSFLLLSFLIGSETGIFVRNQNHSTFNLKLLRLLKALYDASRSLFKELKHLQIYKKRTADISRQVRCVLHANLEHNNSIQSFNKTG